MDEGERLIKLGETEAAAERLAQARMSPSTRLEAHNLMERHALPGAFGAWMGVNCEISPQDDIYRFFDGHPTSVNPLRDYLADGWRTLSELMLLLESVDRPLLGARSFLEFASGHGRFSRHLLKALDRERVTVSDVVPDAMRFATDVLGAKAVLSSARPEALVLPQRYDMVFVLSLFSHLPQSTWGRWLSRLYEAVAPGGVLVFSTHGEEAARRQGVKLDTDGYFFAPSSESKAIDAEQYGTTFTNERFVRDRIGAELGDARVTAFKPVWFWHHQDAWVVSRPVS